MTSDTKTRGRPPSPTEGATAAVEEIKTMKKRLKLTDEALAELIGMDQSTVTRALGREIPAWTPALRKLWHHVLNRDGSAEEAQPIEREPSARSVRAAEEALTRAVLDAWDGTQEGLDGLVRVLSTLREYRRPQPARSRVRVRKSVE